jgi:hypothetical protein
MQRGGSVNEALVLVVLLWAVLLLPSALRSRSSSSPHVTVGGFARAMEVLRASPSDSDGRQVLVPTDAGRVVDSAAPLAGSDARTRSGDPQRSDDRTRSGAASRSGAELRSGDRSRLQLERRGPDGSPAARHGTSTTSREELRVVSRRLWFIRLLVGTAVSLLAAIVVGGVVWGVALLSIAGTTGYVVFLRRLKVQRDEVRSVVRELAPRPASDDPPVAVAVGGDHRPSGTVRLRRWDG